MDMDKVELQIKKETASNFERIKGDQIEAIISEGGRLGEPIINHSNPIDKFNWLKTGNLFVNTNNNRNIVYVDGHNSLNILSSSFMLQTNKRCNIYSTVLYIPHILYLGTNIVLYIISIFRRMYEDG